jgi:N-acetylglutamate synthase-like GNAT family acetyltransferase
VSAIGNAHPVIGALLPFAEQLAPMFQAFHADTVHGLAAVRNERLDILAVVAVHPGRGDFGRFLDECQKNYQTIGIWEVWNGSLALYLKRRGFREVREELDGDLVNCRLTNSWRKKTVESPSRSRRWSTRAKRSWKR